MVRLSVILLVGACLLLAACEPVAIAILGAGASTALRYNMDGVASRTFTAPVAAVKSASLAALEIELEQISKQATRIRIIAKGGSLFYDNATAYELVQQTEKLLEAGLAAAKLTPAVPAQAPAAAG